MALNGTAIIGNRVLQVFRSNTDEYVSPDTLINNIQMASEQLQNQFLGLIMMYGPGRPIPAQASSVTSDIRNLLDPFRRKVTFVTNLQSQISIANTSDITNNDLQITKWEVWRRNKTNIFFPVPEALSDFLESQVNFPTNEMPIGVYEEEDTIIVYPDADASTIIDAYVFVGEGQLKLGFIPGKNNKVDPDPTITTATKWNQRAWDCLVYLTLQIMGIQSTQPFLLQSVQTLKQTSV